jgi:hypothetical protein
MQASFARMTQRTHHGSCLCKRVTWEAELDLAAGSMKCNCRWCAKQRLWSVKVKPEHFRCTSGESELTAPVFEEGRPRHGNFCRHCGLNVFAQVPAAEWNDGAYVSVNVATIDDLTPEEVAAIPVLHLNGRDDDWFNLPKVTSHL